MANNQNPFDLHTITPYLVVKSVPVLVEFIQRVFEAELRGDLYRREDGSVKHAEMRIGDSVVMMGEPTADVDVMPGMLYVYVDDCDSVYNKALSEGATSVLKPENYPHGDRYGGVKDPVGNVWFVVTHIGETDQNA